MNEIVLRASGQWRKSRRFVGGKSSEFTLRVL
jgi:hypothetical protein